MHRNHRLYSLGLPTCSLSSSAAAAAAILSRTIRTTNLSSNNTPFTWYQNLNCWC